MCFEVVVLRTTDWVPSISDTAVAACYQALDPFRRGRDVIAAASLLRSGAQTRRHPELVAAVEQYLADSDADIQATVARLCDQNNEPPNE